MKRDGSGVLVEEEVVVVVLVVAVRRGLYYRPMLFHLDKPPKRFTTTGRQLAGPTNRERKEIGSLFILFLRSYPNTCSSHLAVIHST